MSVLPLASSAVRTSQLITNTVSTSLHREAGSGHGPLSQQQLDTLRAAVGYDFNWPPSPDSGPFPLAAAFLADHVNFSNAFTAQQPLTADSLKALAAAGLLSAAAAERGAAYLRGERATNSNGDDAVVRPVPGMVAADGSLYL